MDDRPTIETWRGKILADCSREELIDAVKFLGKKYLEYLDKAHIIAAGEIEMMRRGK